MTKRISITGVEKVVLTKEPGSTFFNKCDSMAVLSGPNDKRLIKEGAEVITIYND